MSLTISRSTGKLKVTSLLAVLAIDMGMIYPMTSYAFFFILGISLASSFEHVDSMLSRHLSQVNKMTDGLVLTEIRSIHGLVCRAVHRLNDSFQTLSFIHVVFVFTAVVNTSFTLIVQPRFNINVFFYTMETFVRLWLLGFACDRIQKKVRILFKKAEGSLILIWNSKGIDMFDDFDRAEKWSELHRIFFTWPATGILSQNVENWIDDTYKHVNIAWYWSTSCLQRKSFKQCRNSISTVCSSWVVN